MYKVIDSCKVGFGPPSYLVQVQSEGKWVSLHAFYFKEDAEKWVKKQEKSI